MTLVVTSMFVVPNMNAITKFVVYFSVAEHEYKQPMRNVNFNNDYTYDNHFWPVGTMVVVHFVPQFCGSLTTQSTMNTLV